MDQKLTVIQRLKAGDLKVDKAGKLTTPNPKDLKLTTALQIEKIRVDKLLPPAKIVGPLVKQQVTGEDGF